MIFSTKKEEVFSLKEFLARQPKEPIQSESPQSNYTRMFGFMGINVTHHTFFSSAFSGAYFVVFAVAGIALLSTFLEYICRRKGKDNTADIIETVTKLSFPLAFYLYLYFGIVSTF